MVAPAKLRRIPTDQELMDLPKDGFKRELLNGEIVMSPAGAEHGWLIMQLASDLHQYVRAHQLGAVFDGQTGFRMRNRDVLSPDISFIPRARSADLVRKKGFIEGAPDLAIEFVSPRESKKRLKEKLTQYFENGTRLAWVIDPGKRTVVIHRGVKPDRTLTDDQELSGDDLVPGFCIPVSRIFEDAP